MLHTDSENFSHALSAFNVLLTDWYAVALALPLHSGQSVRMRRWRTSALALVVGLSMGGCGGGQPDLAPQAVAISQCRVEEGPTAGNRVAWFLGDVQQGRQPMIQGGVEDPFGCAYAQLCGDIKSRVGEKDFRTSKGELVSPVLSADTWRGARSPGEEYEYRVGVDEERPDIDTLDPALEATWKDGEFTWFEQFDDDSTVTGSRRTERWRIGLVREMGSWRVCTFAVSST